MRPDEDIDFSLDEFLRAYARRSLGQADAKTPIDKLRERDGVEVAPLASASAPPRQMQPGFFSALGSRAWEDAGRAIQGAAEALRYPFGYGPLGRATRQNRGERQAGQTELREEEVEDLAKQFRRMVVEGPSPTISTALDAPGRTAGEAIGSTAGFLAGGAAPGAAVGALLGSVVPGVGTKVGAAVGALAGTALSSFGTHLRENITEQFRAGAQPGDVDTTIAARTALGQSALDVAAVGVLGTAGRLARVARIAPRPAPVATREGVGRALLVGGGAGALSEGLTEGAQEALTMWQAGTLGWPDADERIGTAALMGAIGGGTLGGISRVMGRPPLAPPPAPPAAPAIQTPPAQPTQPTQPTQPAPQAPAAAPAQPSLPFPPPPSPQPTLPFGALPVQPAPPAPQSPPPAAATAVTPPGQLALNLQPPGQLNLPLGPPPPRPQTPFDREVESAVSQTMQSLRDARISQADETAVEGHIRDTATKTGRIVDALLSSDKKSFTVRLHEFGPSGRRLLGTEVVQAGPSFAEAFRKAVDAINARVVAQQNDPKSVMPAQLHRLVDDFKSELRDLGYDLSTAARTVNNEKVFEFTVRDDKGNVVTSTLLNVPQLQSADQVRTALATIKPAEAAGPVKAVNDTIAKVLTEALDAAAKQAASVDATTRSRLARTNKLNRLRASMPQLVRTIRNQIADAVKTGDQKRIRAAAREAVDQYIDLNVPKLVERKPKPVAPAKQARKTEKAEKAEQAKPTEKTEQAKPTEKTEKTEKAKPAEQAEQAEQAKPAEQAEKPKKTRKTAKVEKEEQPEPAETDESGRAYKDTYARLRMDPKQFSESDKRRLKEDAVKLVELLKEHDIPVPRDLEAFAERASNSALSGALAHMRMFLARGNPELLQDGRLSEAATIIARALKGALASQPDDPSAPPKERLRALIRRAESVRRYVTAQQYSSLDEYVVAIRGGTSLRGGRGKRFVLINDSYFRNFDRLTEDVSLAKLTDEEALKLVEQLRKLEDAATTWPLRLMEFHSSLDDARYSIRRRQLNDIADFDGKLLRHAFGKDLFDRFQASPVKPGFVSLITARLKLLNRMFADGPLGRASTELRTLLRAEARPIRLSDPRLREIFAKHGFDMMRDLSDTAWARRVAIVDLNKLDSYINNLDMPLELKLRMEKFLREKKLQPLGLHVMLPPNEALLYGYTHLVLLDSDANALSGRTDGLMSTLIHEAGIHAPTQMWLDMQETLPPGERSPIYTSLERLHRVAAHYMSREDKQTRAYLSYGVSELKEFVAEGLSDVVFQAWLASKELPQNVPISASPVWSMWDTFLFYVNKILSSIGITQAAKDRNLLHVLLPLGEAAIMRGKQYADAYTATVFNPTSKKAVPIANEETLLTEVTIPDFAGSFKPKLLAQRSRWRLQHAGVSLRRFVFGFTPLDTLRTQYEHLFSWTNEVKPLIGSVIGSGRFADFNHNPLRLFEAAVNARQSFAAQFREDFYNRSPIDRLRALSAAERQQLADLLYDATINELWPNKPFSAPENSHRKGAFWQAVHADLERRWNALTAEQKKLWTDTVDYIDYHQTQAIVEAAQNAIRYATVRDQVENVAQGKPSRRAAGLTDSDIMVHLSTPVPPPSQRTAAWQNREAEVAQFLGKDTMRILRDTLANKGGVRGPYFPLHRFGAYVVSWRIDPSKPEREVEHRFATQADADAFAAKTYNSGGIVLDVYVEHVDPQTGKTIPASQVASLPPAAYKTNYVVRVQNQGAAFFEDFVAAKEAMAELEAQGLKPIMLDRKDFESGNLAVALPDLRPVLNQLKGMGLPKDVIDSLEKSVLFASAALRGHAGLNAGLLHRRKVVGYSRDMLRTLANFGNGIASYRAALATGIESDIAFTVMQQHSRGVRDSDSMKRDLLLTELRMRSDMTIDPIHEGPLQLAARRLQQFTFSAFLLSGAFPLMQLIQVFQTTIPAMAARFGLGNTLRELNNALFIIGPGAQFVEGTKAAADAMKRFITGKEMENLSYVARLRESIRNANPPDRADLERLITAIVDFGRIEPSMGAELGRLATPSQSRVARYFIDPLFDLGRAMPAAAETVARSMTAIATYRLARRSGMTHSEAVRLADDVVTKTLGDYKAAASGRFFNRWAYPLMSPMLTFRKYSALIYALIGQNLYRAFKGATPEDRTLARKLLLGTAASHLILAGIEGVPFIEGLRILGMVAGLALGEDEPIDMFAELRKIIGELTDESTARTLMRGPVNTLTNVNIADRIGLGNLILMRDIMDYRPETLLGYAGAFVLGAPGSLVAQTLGSAREFERGEKPWEVVAANMIPIKVIRDAARALDMHDRGIQTRRGEPLIAPDEITLGEKLIQVFGFGSESVAEAYAQRARVMRRYKQLDDERSRLMNRYYRAVENNDNSARWKAMAAISEWNSSIRSRYGLQARELLITREQLMRGAAERRRRQFDVERSRERFYIPPRYRFLHEEEGRFYGG